MQAGEYSQHQMRQGNGSKAIMNGMDKRQSFRPARTVLSIIISVIALHGAGVNVYTDTLSAGWNYMDSCVTFEIPVDSACSVSWTVTKMKKEYDNKDGRLTLSSQSCNSRSFTGCPYSFREVKARNEQILDSVFSRWPATRFKSVSWSSFRHGNDYSWNIPIALQSAKSPKYAEYRKKYPDTKYTSNGLFVDFANETGAYRELSDVFEKHGLELKLISVEKVFAGKVRELEFREELRKKGLRPDDSVIWDVGMSYFSLEFTGDKGK
jgi:hypothetical protein